MSIGADDRVRVFPSPELLAQNLADWIVTCACGEPHRFAICLSGGSTPERLYQLLGASPRRERLPWQRMHWFWGDERVVPHDDPRSNFRMAFDAMLRHAPAPARNIHPMPTDVAPAAGAAAYEAMLKEFYGNDALDAARPLFDLTLLGLGEDGHIASLFPGSAALAETRRWALPVVGADGLERITLTYPALAGSAAVAFMVAGARKRSILARALAGDPALPAARLHPRGIVFWFADRAAAPAPAFSTE